MAASRVIGVVGGSDGGLEGARRLFWIEQPLPVTGELLAMAAPAKPTEVFRFAAHCEENACCHFDGTNCQLATRIVQILPVVSESLPPCRIRSDCRWFQQEGRPACMRCPQVITQTYNAAEEYAKAAMP